MKQRAGSRSRARWSPVLLVVLLCALPAPHGGERDLIYPSPAELAAVGSEALGRFLTEHPESADVDLAYRVDRVGRSVGKASDRPTRVFRFLVVEGETPQGFAFPGGTICVTEGLVQVLAVDDQLAFALGHELAHVILRHHVTQVRFQEAVRSGGSADRAVLTTLKSSFDAESQLEADRYGALYAVRAGFAFSESEAALRRLRRSEYERLDRPGFEEYDARIQALRGFHANLALAIEAFESGTDSLMARDPEQAISKLELFTAQFPNSVAGHVNLGASYLTLVRELTGTPHGLSEIVPFLPEADIGLRGSLIRVELERARGHFAEAARLQPDDVHALAGLALVESRIGDLEGARHHLGRALQMAPASSQLLLCRGNVEFIEGRYEEAIAYYLQALELSPGLPEANRNLALAHERQPDPARAVARWRELIEDERYGPEARDHIERLSRLPVAPG